MKKLYTSLLIVLLSLLAYSQTDEPGKMVINADLGEETISRHIYGHFSEHLGRCIYGGFYVGEDSPIPNVNGIRTDVVDALRDIKIPNLRWPGGCFADTYHWMDGVGPKSERPTIVNTHWGGVVEDNSFGTHEFMDLCEQLETEPYICGNVGSGTVEEMSDWVEYLTSDGESPMANLRRQNGREDPWKVKYWGVGNENWGCGGSMTAEFYADQYKRYATYCKDYSDNRLYRIAGGPNRDNYHWMDVMMKNIPRRRMDGVSLHYYTVTKTWADKGSATEFNRDEYLTNISKGFEIDDLISMHSTIMDRYDPEKRIGLIVDEWGTWHNAEPGTNPGFLYQQNTLRDAIVAAISLNIFNEHCDRVKMANIAQTVNVLQALILTEDEKMLLTPTYHVYDMYKVHHDATLLPLYFKSKEIEVNGKKIPLVQATASKNSKGKIHVTFVNIDPENEATIEAEIRGGDYKKIVEASIITSENLNDHNTFDDPKRIKIEKFDRAKIKNGKLSITLPAKSVVLVGVDH